MSSVRTTSPAHTAGPDYKCFPTPWFQKGIAVIADNGEKVAWAETMAWGQSQAERIASLIAAAPELLEALEATLLLLPKDIEHIEFYNFVSSLINRVKAQS